MKNMVDTAKLWAAFRRAAVGMQQRLAYVTRDELAVTPDGHGGRYIRIAGLEFEFHIKYNEQGRPVLHSPTTFKSDFHLGTRQCRAKRLCGVEDMTSADLVYLIGDILDGEHDMTKDRASRPEWQRQVIGHIVRKAGTGTRTILLPGNHDLGVREQTMVYGGTNEGGDYELPNGKILRRGDKLLHHNLCGRPPLAGIEVTEKTYFTDPKGRRFKIIHGDQFDDMLFGYTKGFWYSLGSDAHDFVVDLDEKFQRIPRCKDMSLAALGKRATKIFINYVLYVRHATMKAVDAEQGIDGIMYGHSHMQEMAHTKKGKLVINTGCCTEYVQETRCDRHGNMANLTFHGDYMLVRTENGQRRAVPLDVLGFPPLHREPAKYDDEYMKTTDTLYRLMDRLWPSRERQRQRAEAEILRQRPDRKAGELVMPPLSHPRSEVLRRREYKKLAA